MVRRRTVRRLAICGAAALCAAYVVLGATLSFEQANEGVGTRRLACSETLAVAAGGAAWMGRPSDARSRRARVWRLDDLEGAEPVTLDFSSDANAVALRPGSEAELAVGTGDGAVRIFSSCLGAARPHSRRS